MKICKNNDKLYILDMQGEVQLIDLQEKTQTKVVLGGQNKTICTDIHVTDQALLIQSCYQLESKPGLLFSMHERLHYRNEIVKIRSSLNKDSKLTFSQKISKQYQRMNFFQHCLCVENLMFLANGSTLYVRDESKGTKWRQYFNFDHTIVAILYVDKNTIHCLTQRSIQVLKIDPKVKEVSIRASKETSGFVLKVEKSDQAEWNNCRVLFQTIIPEKKVYQLWTCTPDLSMFLLLEDNIQNGTNLITKDSYFIFINVDSKDVEKEEEDQQEDTDQLALICQVGKFAEQPYRLYTMPDVQQNKEKILKSQLRDNEKVLPLFQLKGEIIFQLPKRANIVAQGLAIREVRCCDGRYYVAFIKWTQNNATQIIVLDSSLNQIVNQEYHGLCIEKVAHGELNGHLLIYDNQQGLYAINTRYLNKCIVPQKILVSTDDGNDNTTMFISDQNVWLLHASGKVQSIKRELFDGKKQLEKFKQEDYLVWKQHQHLFAAVNRFNVVSYWNTFTGKLIHRQRLEGKERIEDAHFYTSYSYQPCSQNHYNIFDEQPQALMCNKKREDMFRSGGKKDQLKLVNFNIFEQDTTKENQAFKASCETICEFQVNIQELRDIWSPGLGLKETYDKYAYFYNKELKLVIVAMKIGYIMTYRQKEEGGQWILCSRLNQKCKQISSLHHEQGFNLVENHISPDGKYLLSCTNGLKVYKFVLNKGNDDITLQDTKWELPIETSDISIIELATRVKFEASDIIRFLTIDNRDILYQLKTEETQAHYLTEVKIENQYQTDLTQLNWDQITHKITIYDQQNELKNLIQRNSLFRVQYWHKQLLNENHEDLINKNQRKLNRIDFISPMQKSDQNLSVQFSFQILDWLLVEQIAANEGDIQQIDDNHKLKLSLYIFPKQKSILHIIAENAQQDDQNSSASTIRQILEAAEGFMDEDVTGEPEPVKFNVPIIPNMDDKLPLKLMHELDMRALSDTLMSYTQFRCLIHSQDAIDRVVSQNAPNLIKCLESSLEETEICSKIETMDLPNGKVLITFRSDSSTLNAKEIQRKALESIKQKEGGCIGDDDLLLVSTPVKVKILDIRWLKRGGQTFMDFAAIMDTFTLDSLFNTEFLRAITNEYWDIYKPPILIRAFIPWVLYSSLSIGYFAKVLDPGFDYKTEEKAAFWKFSAIVVILLTCYQLYIELLSSCSDFIGHWKSPYNWLDLFMYTMTIWIVMQSMTTDPVTNVVWQRNIATFVFIAQGSKVVLDWLRLFDDLSFYVTLIIRTIVDIKWISFIIFVIFVYFGSAMYMLQLNSDSSEDDSVVPPVFGNFFIDMMINQFQLMMGAVETDSFEEHNFMAICYILYIAAMIISNVTFLNMLIAIMGDTFDRVIDQRPTFSLKNRIMILASYHSLIPKSSKVTDSDVFIYVITPNDEETETTNEDAWRGKLFYLQNLIKAKFNRDSNQMDKCVSDLTQKIQSTQQQMNERFQVNEIRTKERSKQIDLLHKGMKRLSKILKSGRVRALDDGDDVDSEQDDDDQSNQSAGSARMSKELVVGTTAGFTDQVRGYKFELDDMEAAYNKVVNDWNMQGKHNGFNVQHGFGTWGIYQTSATEYTMVSSHAENIMKLKLPLNLIDAKKLQRASSVHFQCSVKGTSQKKDDKYRVSLKLFHNDQVIKKEATCEDGALLECDVYGNEINIDYEIDLSDIDQAQRSELVVEAECAGKDVEFWAGNHGTEFSKQKLFLKF